MKIYLDTSTVLRVLLKQKPVLRGWGNWTKAYSSELLGIEARRTFDRLRLGSALDDELLARVHEQLADVEGSIGVIGLTSQVFRRASLPMATPMKTLDAMHLATAMLLREHLGEALVFATHDAQQSIGARALGFTCKGV